MTTSSDIEQNNFSFDIERMDKCLKSPRFVVPDEVLKDFEAFDKWINEIANKTNN